MLFVVVGFLNFGCLRAGNDGRISQMPSVQE
jgi:hypothetical protein